MTAATKPCPITKTRDVHKSGGINLSQNKTDRLRIVRPNVLEPIDVARVQVVIMCANEGPHVVGVATELGQGRTRLGKSASDGVDSGKHS